MRRSPRSEGETPEISRPRRELSPAEQRDALLNYAFRALSQRALTSAELRGRLERRSTDAALIDEVLVRVQELGYQNDAEVARSEGNRRTVGRFKIKQTLQRRGLADDLIEEALGERDPDQEWETVRELLARRWAGFQRKRDPKASAYAFLARRGFGSAVIWRAIREVEEAMEEEDLD